MRNQARHYSLLSLLASAIYVTGQNLSSSQVNTIKSQLSSTDLQSWEIGTYSQALLELDTPSWSTLTPGVSFPSVAAGSSPSSLDEVFAYAKTVAQNWTVVNHVSSDNASSIVAPLLANSAVGDPPSIGFTLVLANLTGRAQADGVAYADAATSQLEYLLEGAPKTPDGAISHRPEQTQLWADFVYMVPPFLAFYGTATGNETVARMAWEQVKLYRQYLKSNNTQTTDSGQSTVGLWQHMALGSGADEGFWSTGNAWAAGGIVRVLGTFAASPMSSSLQTEQADLVQWAHEIQLALGTWVDSESNLLHNYANDTTGFLDAASSVLYAASVYRLATLLDAGLPASSAKSSDGTSVGKLVSSVHGSVPIAERIRSTVFTAQSSSTGSGLAHFTSDLALTPVVNPLNWGAQLQLPATETKLAANNGLAMSPEGQAFVLEMQAAYRDWVGAGSPGQNAAFSMRFGGVSKTILAFVVGLGMWILV
ncbi:hypothetical protein PHLGIDRAFT_31058 [Phlebiopsis gigantea 11061_1 CR5-6]|uniref:Glycoside hydrolase family 105 protein n=1 Tax=Phlebiopsis gigantea (strain 11061_1 CR5-6) TaxID=745531 RepID=A0A0C3PGX4_PHLG1|nr:hypothetical protein PHLGIDRAFT_31058 [Phlebiopsis gigantea 11061_1 CR5-6]